MKFRDPKTGKVFDTIDALNHQYCSTINDCDDCPIFSANNRTGELCNCFCLNYPAEAARLMGYEVIEDEKEVNMERKDKPLREWTLGEVYDFCHSDDAFCTASDADCPFWRTVCNKRAFDWSLGPRLTEAEMAIMRATGARWVTRDDNTLCPDVSLWREEPVKNGRTYGGNATPLAIVSNELFPSVHPGDCICVEETGDD